VNAPLMETPETRAIYARDLARAEAVALAALSYHGALAASGGRHNRRQQHALFDLCKALIAHDLGNAEDQLDVLCGELGIDRDGDKLSEDGYPLTSYGPVRSAGMGGGL
jgi:hypothetical protein